MSKIRKKKTRTFSEGEVRKTNREVANNATCQTILLSIVTAREMFGMDEETTVKFVETMRRYADYVSYGILNLDDFSKSLLKETGIDLRIVNREM